METRIIFAPKEVLLRGYSSKIHELLDDKYHNSGYPLHEHEVDKWAEENEAYYKELHVHFYLIRKSVDERLEVKVNIEGEEEDQG